MALEFGFGREEGAGAEDGAGSEEEVKGSADSATGEKGAVGVVVG